MASSLARPPALADNVGVALGRSGVFGRVEAGIHASEDGEMPAGRQRQAALVAETGLVLRVGRENFTQNLAHGVWGESVRCWGLETPTARFVCAATLTRIFLALNVLHLGLVQVEPGYPAGAALTGNSPTGATAADLPSGAWAYQKSPRRVPRAKA